MKHDSNLLERAIAKRGIHEPPIFLPGTNHSKTKIYLLVWYRDVANGNREWQDPGHHNRCSPAMAPTQDPAFSWVIRTIPINGTRNINEQSLAHTTSKSCCRDGERITEQCKRTSKLPTKKKRRWSRACPASYLTNFRGPICNDSCIPSI